jgi:stage II sporulation protein D
MSQYGAYGYALHGAGYRQILAHYYTGTSLSPTNPNQTVGVLLATGPASFSGATKAGSTKLTPAQIYTVKLLKSGRLALVGAKHRQLKRTFVAPLKVTGSAPLTVPAHGTYRGALEFRPDGQGAVQTVNALGLDDYVRGVIAEEMPSSWAAQALDAQAVAARTYAVTTSVGGNGYDLYPDTRSQMYGGVGAETAATDAAVRATRGQVVTYQGRPVVTYFFASSGGHTESVQDAWPGSSPEPWLVGVADPYDNAGGDPYHSWGEQLALSAAAGKLGHLVKGSLVGITVTRHGLSPRIIQAVVTGTKGVTTVSGGQLQRAFGLLTTDAAFTTITTNATLTMLRGKVFPATSGAGYSVQELGSGGWKTISHAQLGTGGVYATGLPAAGTYRIRYGSLDGPAVTAATPHAAVRLRADAQRELRALLRLSRRGLGLVAPMGRLARYAWPVAGNRRPLRPVPLLLRAP